MYPGAFILKLWCKTHPLFNMKPSLGQHFCLFYRCISASFTGVLYCSTHTINTAHLAGTAVLLHFFMFCRFWAFFVSVFFSRRRRDSTGEENGHAHPAALVDIQPLWLLIACCLRRYIFFVQPVSCCTIAVAYLILRGDIEVRTYVR